MSAAQVKALTGDKRRREAALWKAWMDEIPGIRREFNDWLPDMDPFGYNEAATAGMLANAASKAGLLSLTEYVMTKRHSTRGRPFRRGRGDLWLGDSASQVCWGFEFKQRRARPGLREDTFDGYLELCRSDACALHDDEADWKVGGLVLLGKDFDTAAIDRIDSYCSHADFSYRIGGLFPVWLCFVFAK